MAKEPHTRTLCAEPLEERLPVSSSAAGVLLGFGFATSEKEPGVSTPGYEVANEYNSTTPPFTTRFEFDDTTLAATLDAMIVDRILGEDASDTTPGLASGALSSDADPFEVTPLSTTEGMSDDAATDPMRQIGDELLLIQISTLDFTQSQFGYMTPESTQHESTAASHNLDDALDVPTDATEYGFSPLVDDLEKDDGVIQQASCGCGSGCGAPDPVPYVANLQISGCGYALTYDKNTGFNYSDRTFYTMAPGVVVRMTGASAFGGSTITVENDPDGLLVRGAGSVGSGITFSWVVPSGQLKSEVQNEFTFVFHVWNSSGSDTVKANVHFGWAETQVRFAGQGAFRDRSYLNDDNTVIVGQKVEAVVTRESSFEVVNNMYTWNSPTGGLFVKDYETSDAKGEIKYHISADYNAQLFSFYYSAKTTAIGGVSCSYYLKDPHGFMHSVTTASSYYLETPVCNSFTSQSANWGNGKPAVDVRKHYSDNGYADWLTYGGREIVNGQPLDLDGIKWTANFTTNAYTPGFFAYAQLIASDRKQYVGNAASDIVNTHNQFVLDMGHPYPDGNMKKYFLGNRTDNLSTGDAPGIALHDTIGLDGLGRLVPKPTLIAVNSTKVTISESFSTYFIYKPDGDSIWVTLAMMNWGWSGTATKNASGSWECTGRGAWGGTGGPSTILPEWNGNIVQYVPQ